MAVTSQFQPGMQYVGQQNVIPPVSGFAGQPSPWLSTAGSIVGGAIAGVVRNLASSSSSTASSFLPTYPEGADIVIDSQQCRPRRRRRRKLLTCGDKADIAFLYGQLGGGQLGRSAISALLSRRCG